MKERVLNGFAAMAVVAVFLVSGAVAQESDSTDFSSVKIINFGKMDDRLYRGGQPQAGDYEALKKLGVTTVVDLRNDPTDYEKPAVEALGMKYVNIPMSGWKSPKDADVEKFMSLMNDPSTGVVYVHCKAGKHRTGLAGAVYRFNRYGWNYDQAYKEMKKYNYTSWPVHFNIKSYVKDYYQRMDKTPGTTVVASAPSATAN
ncbi:MAG: tyrosine-protein phosphatase [Pyrinomonadaceae bacterium]|nr:tyrosine-protein phosphatase [Pyrinomonadaceae bacterium]